LGGRFSQRFPQIAPSHTGNNNTGVSTGGSEGIFPKVAPQFSGTTLARQFTGLGGEPGVSSLMRQITGGGGQLSPTRQLGHDRSGSPTKGMGERHSSMKPLGRERRPRPKSVIGMRGGGKSVDEGRGMFLVRQMTGNASDL
jgi:hypothetical protein